ncbi:hypothetical protein ELH79_03820 [Rhizobium leguminosarum]|nr:hypothetical protein ELH79_03820 [Rhizobium leguminosarum]TAZ08433.1 hypothetical protein ELH78_03820 [Rhizobium leguminosarum]
MWNSHGVVGKTGVAGPLIRPTGTFSPRGEEGIERSRHAPFAPQAGVRRTGRDQWLDPGKGDGSRMRGDPRHKPERSRPPPRRRQQHNRPHSGRLSSRSDKPSVTSVPAPKTLRNRTGR